MKKIIYVCFLLLTAASVYSQADLEIEGKAKITEMEKDNNADSVVVRLENGVLAVRDVSSLLENQNLSLSNDTIYLSDGGFIKLPPEDDGSTTNELQTISRSGLDVTLSDGGGTFQDSVNVYTAGNGINITDNVISVPSSPWYLGQDTLGGIVFFIYRGSDGLDHGLIVDTMETLLSWAASTETVGAGRTWDGAFNTERMDDGTGGSPAKSYIDTRSLANPGDWYLPSIDELMILFVNQLPVNQGLFSGGHTMMNTNGTYWSSTEFNSGSNAWNMSFTSGTKTSGTSKTVARGIRAIRAF